MPIAEFAEFISKEVPPCKIVEVGIGFHFDVALILKEKGYDVLAVDWNGSSVERARSLGINAVRDDVFHPDHSIYGGAGAIYAVRPTPEIVGPILKLGRELGVPVYILPLTGDAMPRGMRLRNFRGLAIYTAKPI